MWNPISVVRFPMIPKKNGLVLSLKWAPTPLGGAAVAGNQTTGACLSQPARTAGPICSGIDPNFGGEIPPPLGGWTQRTVWRAIARCGGFLNRKGDGEPGWITIWRGWRTLDNDRGHHVMPRKTGK
jgi:hypothetical protein